MGQEEVFTFLKKHKGIWFTAKEIANGLGVGASAVSVTAVKLSLSRFIQCRYNHKPRLYKYRGK